MQHTGQRRCKRRAPLPRDLARYRIDRVNGHRHRQLVEIPVIQNAPPRRNLEGSLLLQRSARYPLRMLYHLQPDQPPKDQRSPPDKDCDHRNHTHPAHRRSNI